MAIGDPALSGARTIDTAYFYRKGLRIVDQVTDRGRGLPVASGQYDQKVTIDGKTLYVTKAFAKNVRDAQACRKLLPLGVIDICFQRWGEVSLNGLTQRNFGRENARRARNAMAFGLWTLGYATRRR